MKAIIRSKKHGKTGFILKVHAESQTLICALVKKWTWETLILCVNLTEPHCLDTILDVSMKMFLGEVYINISGLGVKQIAFHNVGGPQSVEDPNTTKGWHPASQTRRNSPEDCLRTQIAILFRVSSLPTSPIRFYIHQASIIAWTNSLNKSLCTHTYCSTLLFCFSGKP